jgi:hypothetical protein
MPKRLKPDTNEPEMKYFKPASLENAEFRLKVAKT